MQVNKILLTTDLSDESLRAFEPVATLARQMDATVTLLHVVEDVPIVAHGAPGSPPLHAPSIPDMVDNAKESIATQVKSMPAGVAVTTDVITGARVAEAVAKYAEENGASMIALSTHGRSGFKRFFLGSVAEEVLRHAHVPVLVFPRNK